MVAQGVAESIDLVGAHDEGRALEAAALVEVAEAYGDGPVVELEKLDGGIVVFALDANLFSDNALSPVERKAARFLGHGTPASLCTARGHSPYG